MAQGSFWSLLSAMSLPNILPLHLLCAQAWWVCPFHLGRPSPAYSWLQPHPVRVCPQEGVISEGRNGVDRRRGPGVVGASSPGHGVVWLAQLRHSCSLC